MIQKVVPLGYVGENSFDYGHLLFRGNLINGGVVFYDGASLRRTGIR